MRAIVFSSEGRAVVPPLRGALRARGWDLVEVASERELLALAQETGPNLIVIQSATPSGETLAITRGLRSSAARVPLLLITRTCPGELAIAAMRAGFNDVLLNCCSESDAAEALARLLHPGERPAADPLIAGNLLVGGSPAAAQLRHAIQRVAATDSNVLITGETGTGKELTAELIHRNSRRRDKPFVSINCAAIPDSLLESELFGYERGAFTGAHAAREGKLQYAQGGTLFLDEVGDMNLYAQAKILRAIESRKVQRLGGNREIAVNLRIIAATNHNLEQLTWQQKFRQDLYFRLNVARIAIPPLRDRAEDVPALVDHLLAELAPRLERRAASVDPSFLAPLLRYDWPGNVRELENVVERAIAMTQSPLVEAEDLPVALRERRASSEDDLGAAVARGLTLAEVERDYIKRVLQAEGGNKTRAAQRLGLDRKTLYRKLEEYAAGGTPPEDDEGGSSR
jgi:DNA-binding NtrC family response regulator